MEKDCDRTGIGRSKDFDPGNDIESLGVVLLASYERPSSVLYNALATP